MCRVVDGMSGFGLVEQVLRVSFSLLLCRFCVCIGSAGLSRVWWLV